MDIDIQSSVLNELFVLYPLIIQGWVSPVKPDGSAHGGIPKALYDDQPKGLECLVDPWTELQVRSWTMAADDRVDLYVNDDPTPATGKTVESGQEQLRVRLYLPHGYLNQGVNRLHYKVTRVGGNVEPSRDLLVLYNLRTPESLDLVIPPDVLKNGVDAARAAQGVEFGFTWSNRRNYDRIEFLLGDTTLRFNAADLPAPVTQKLFTDAFQKAGDNTSAVLEFFAVDQLGNRSKSPEKRLDIHLSRLTLLPPTVRGQTSNNFSPTQPEIRVLVPQGPLLPSDKLSVIWTGATAVTAGSYASPQRLVSAGLEIAVPRSVLAYSLGKTVTVTYVIERDGVSTTSPALPLNILELPKTALIPPKILEADASNVLDTIALGSKNATIHALLHTLIEAGQHCWMNLEGIKADGTVHNLTLMAGSPAKVNDTWINQGFWPVTLANSFLKELGHGSTLTIKYKVALDKSNLEANAVVFPDRVYTIKAVELVRPTLTNVLDDKGIEVLEAGLTVSTTLTVKGAASKGLQVEIYDGSGASAVPKGKATADAATGLWTLTINVPTGARRLYAKSLYHSSSVYSNVRTLTVTELVLPTITTVKGSASGEDIPNDTTTSETAVVLTGKASKGLKVNIMDGTESQGQPTANVSTGEWTQSVGGLSEGFHRFTAKALYGTQPVSAARTLTVEVIPALNPGPNKVMNLVTFIVAQGRPPAYLPTEATFTQAASGGQPPYNYVSSNTGVATVTSTGGAVTCRANGDTTITVTDARGIKASYTLKVSGIRTMLQNDATWRTWPEAYNYCVARGGRLASVAEMSAFYNLYAREARNVAALLGWPLIQSHPSNLFGAWLLDGNGAGSHYYFNVEGTPSHGGGGVLYGLHGDGYRRPALCLYG